MYAAKLLSFYCNIIDGLYSAILETLSNISRDAVGKLLKRVKKGFNKEDVGYLRHSEAVVAVSHPFLVTFFSNLQF